MMKFYQENKVNPFGACLPLVFQLPVFISLFYMLRKDLRYDICPEINAPNGTELHGSGFPKACGTDAAHFLGIHDITNKATGTVLIVLIVLYVGSQLISTLIMSQPTMDRNQRYLMMALPVVFVPFVINFPAGLLVYWITTNLWTLAQQFTIRETLGRRWDAKWEAEEAAKAEQAAASGSRSKRPSSSGSAAATAEPAAETPAPSGFMGRMLARAQDAQQQAATQNDAKARGGGRATAKPKPARAGGDESTPAPRPAAGPPPSARQKKKRSGRRR